MNGNAMVESEPKVHVQPRTAEVSYGVMVSPRFIVTSLLSSMLLAFAVGRAARHVLLEGPRNAVLLARRQSTLWPDYGREASLPSIVTKGGKPVPQTRYLSRNFDTSRSASSSSWLVTNRDETSSGEAPRAKEEAEDEGEQHTGGAHLMVDIKDVNGAFLNSEQRLAQAMVDVVNEANMTMLSYHCHGLTPAGVSCVGILPQGYVSFHTWPIEGVITFDLCVGGSHGIMPVLRVIRRHFGVPRLPSFSGQVVEQPETKWAHKLRGFRPNSNYFSTDADLFSTLGYALKEEIASFQTDFQQIDIYDVLLKQGQSLLPYRKSLSNNGSYESRNPFLFQPDRLVTLDGWLQSTSKGEAAYHEALVHPALFTHANPKRVSIIGGGEAATLREVLKHNTIEKAVMIEIDEMMVTVSRDFLPQWSNCSNLVGSAAWCVEDPRTTMYYEDALAWFMDRYGNDIKSDHETMDVIIMDALDPESDVPFARALYGNDKSMKAFYSALSDDGILVMQLGEARDEFDPDETHSKFKNRAATTSLLERVGFESIHVYEESHCEFRAPWSFVVAFKSYSTRKRWYANVAEFDLDIQKRAVRTKSGLSPFHYFDGPTMVSYQVPNRAVETVFCRRKPTPENCVIDQPFFDSNYPNVPSSSFEVKKSGVGDNAGRGVFTKINIAQDTYFSAETGSQGVMFMPSTVSLIEDLVYEPVGHELEALLHYMYGYGYMSRRFGEREVIVDSGAFTFTNHGCKGKYNVGVITAFDEETANTNVMPDEVGGKSHEGTSIFNPVVDRHLTFDGFINNRDIQAGEEILDNYLAFTSSEEDWENDVIALRNQCAGRAIGEVTEYERARQKARTLSSARPCVTL